MCKIIEHRYDVVLSADQLATLRAIPPCITPAEISRILFENFDDIDGAIRCLVDYSVVATAAPVILEETPSLVVESNELTQKMCMFCETSKYVKHYKCKSCKNILCDDCYNGDDITPQGVAHYCCKEKDNKKYIVITKNNDTTSISNIPMDAEIMPPNEVIKFPIPDNSMGKRLDEWNNQCKLLYAPKNPPADIMDLLSTHSKIPINPQNIESYSNLEYDNNAI
jgi:hypothetical protein